MSDGHDRAPRVECRAWLEWHGRSLLGRGRLELLERVAQHGSISAAARAINVSYRTAWKSIHEYRAAGRPLVETATGGKGGGGARLTALGQALLEAARLLTGGWASLSRRWTRSCTSSSQDAVPTRSARARRLAAAGP